MKSSIDIENRKPIWIALSSLYLDVELQESDFNHIVKIIAESPYHLEEVKRINKEEVFPVLYKNLVSIAGEWTDFEEDWLVESIQVALQNRNTAKDIRIKTAYVGLKWMFDNYWETLSSLSKFT